MTHREELKPCPFCGSAFVGKSYISYAPESAELAILREQVKVLREALGTMADEPEFAEVLLENPAVLGVGDVSGGTMTLQVLIKTGPNQQWGPTRIVRERAQRALSAAGIRGPILPGRFSDR